jgi:hypothetical protein
MSGIQSVNMNISASFSNVNGMNGSGMNCSPMGEQFGLHHHHHHHGEDNNQQQNCNNQSSCQPPAQSSQEAQSGQNLMNAGQSMVSQGQALVAQGHTKEGMQLIHQGSQMERQGAQMLQQAQGGQGMDPCATQGLCGNNNGQSSDPFSQMLNFGQQIEKNLAGLANGLLGGGGGGGGGFAGIASMAISMFA